VQAIAVLEDADERVGDVEFIAVVDDGGEAVQEIFVHAPLRAEWLGYFENGLDGGFVVLVDIGAPFAVAFVYAVSEAGEEVEVEVVVGVDKAGEGEGAAEVEGGLGVGGRGGGVEGGLGSRLGDGGRGRLEGGDPAFRDPKVMETFDAGEAKVI
jgi:hypothetical protein